jgi:hypothetical protein
MRPDVEPPRDFVDRLMRGLLGRVDNLADFLRCARPVLAGNFAFERGRPDTREFITEDWRRREADLLFEIPYRWAAREIEVLVWVLLEHQSRTDTLVPLRMLFESVMAWAQQWQHWAGRLPPRSALRLQPVFPIVLYTGSRPWGSNETLRDMVDAPPELLELVPDWGPIFWNLSQRTTAELLGAGPFMQLLAVMRASETDQFQGVYRQASANLAALAATQMVRWQELLHGLLSFVLRERPLAEHDALVQVIRETNRPREMEVSTMARTIAEHLIEQGELHATRRLLRRALERKFGPLHESILQRIEACNDVPRLEEAALQAPELEKPEDLSL